MGVRPRDFLRTKKGVRAKFNTELNSWVNENKGMQEMDGACWDGSEELSHRLPA